MSWEEEAPGMYKPLSLDENLYDYFTQKGFLFSKKILTRYYISLKTKPFVILTGISGTGKTKIAQVFADYICQNDKNRDDRVAFVPVRPDWMDNKGVLGFYNILDEKYYATKILDLILAALDTPEKAFFIILDEMNLAKVEHYFSDFLSILESRTPDRPEGMSIHLHSLKAAETPDGRKIPGKIQIPSNIFFTGTVNVDESTYMFSPKVLDRANVIEFNHVDLDGYSKDTRHALSHRLVLENEDVRSGLSDTKPFCSRDDFLEFAQNEKGKNIIKEMLDLLSKYNMHFGYRVINEISRFVNVCEDELQDFDLDRVMDIQILQKILPKFHGTRAKLELPLTELFELCSGRPLEGTGKGRELPDDHARFPQSADKISRMLDQLSSQGYAGFID